MLQALGRDDAVDPTPAIDEYIRRAFRLEPGTETAANVIGVATRLADGMSWPDACQARAEAFAADTPDIEGPDTYVETVRACCTGHLGLSPTEFEDRVHTLIEEYHQRTDVVPGAMTTDPHPTEVPADSYEVRLTDGAEIVAQFGTDPVADHHEILKLVVNHLITEYDLIDRIPIPYVVETTVIINSTPTDPDSGEELPHYTQLTNGYYLDTRTGKDGAEVHLTELAGECGLGVTFGEAWERR